MSWEIRQIYDVPSEDILEFSPFVASFGQSLNINGHELLGVMTRPKSSLLAPLTQADHEGLTVADRVLFLSSQDIVGVSAGESIRVNGKLYKVLSVTRPIDEAIRLDLQGIES